MEQAQILSERIQRLTAKTLATHPAGRGLCLVGGFRYRLLNESARSSTDIDYHWEGDLRTKQIEVAAALQSKLLPEIKRQFGYDGDVRPAVGPETESSAVRTIELALYRMTEPGSRIEIPVDLLDVARLDPPTVRTREGAVFLTVSDADMIESKAIACVARSFLEVRDVFDFFLFQDALRPDSPERLSKKLHGLGLPPAQAVGRLDRFIVQRSARVKEIERLLDEQVDRTVADHLRTGGAGAMIWDSVLTLLADLFAKAREVS